MDKLTFSRRMGRDDYKSARRAARIIFHAAALYIPTIAYGKGGFEQTKSVSVAYQVAMGTIPRELFESFPTKSASPMRFYSRDGHINKSRLWVSACVRNNLSMNTKVLSRTEDYLRYLRIRHG